MPGLDGLGESVCDPRPCAYSQSVIPSRPRTGAFLYVGNNSLFPIGFALRQSIPCLTALRNGITHFYLCGLYIKYTYSKTETTPALDGDEEVVEVENDEVRSALFEKCTHRYHLMKVFPLGRREEISIFWYPVWTAL